MLRICFLIRSLDRGGAQRQLVQLARALDPNRFKVSILTFYRGGALERELEASAVDVWAIRKAGRWDTIGFLRRLHAAVYARQPHVVHGYMGIANELAWLAGRVCGARVVWGIRSTEVDFSKYDWSFGATFRAGAAISRFVDLIIYNSHAGARQYRRAGYRAKKDAIIHNGIDVNRFHHRPDDRCRVRAEWRVLPEQRLVGLVGRFDSMKAHEMFVAAAEELVDGDPEWRFVLVGDNASAYALELRRSAGVRRLGDRLIWAGARDDMPAVYSAMDCLVLASNRGEGQPNVVAEAMACERPCVVTDVGDAAFLVGDTGLVVPIGDKSGLAHACRRLMLEKPDERRRRGTAARQRVAAEFSLERLTTRTGDALEALVEERASRK